ncbi:MAG: hypothetical protein PUF12_06075 [Thermoflexaceae bacterium]|nr:hypothetical protein [Thermoflexaceae bacterium]
MNGNLTAEELQKKMQEDEDKDFREYAMNQIRYLHILEELGIPKDRSIEFFQLMIMQKIADSLYGEDGTVTENLSWICTQIITIANCVISTRDGSALQIIGDVSTSDY